MSIPFANDGTLVATQGFEPFCACGSRCGHSSCLRVPPLSLTGSEYHLSRGAAHERTQHGPCSCEFVAERVVSTRAPHLTLLSSVPGPPLHGGLGLQPSFTHLVPLRWKSVARPLVMVRKKGTSQVVWRHRKGMGSGLKATPVPPTDMGSSRRVRNTGHVPDWAQLTHWTRERRVTSRRAICSFTKSILCCGVPYCALQSKEREPHGFRRRRVRGYRPRHDLLVRGRLAERPCGDHCQRPG